MRTYKPDDDKAKSSTGTEPKKEANITAVREGESTGTQEGSNPYSNLQPILVDYKTFDEKPPTLYDKHQRQTESWLPRTLTPEEEEDRVRGASAVQGIGHLSEAIQAFVNLGGTVNGAAPQKVASAGTIPLAEWTKRQDEKRREAAKTMAEAAQQDYAEYKADYQAWLARKQAVENFNNEAYLANINAGNNAIWKAAEIDAKKDEKKQELEDKKELEKTKGEIKEEVEKAVKQTPAAPSVSYSYSYSHSDKSGGGGGHSDGGHSGKSGKKEESASEKKEALLRKAYAQDGKDGFRIRRSWSTAKIVDEYTKWETARKVKGGSSGGGKSGRKHASGIK